MQAPAESATGEMIFPGPRFPQKSQMGERQFFPTLPQKMPILFHSGNKRHFKLCKSVSNYQKQKSYNNFSRHQQVCVRTTFRHGLPQPSSGLLQIQETNRFYSLTSIKLLELSRKKRCDWWVRWVSMQEQSSENNYE